MIHVWGGSARESWGAIPEYHNAVPVQSAHPMAHFHGMVRPGRQTILSTDRSYRMIEHVRKGGDPSELPDEPGPLADIHSKCPMLEQLAHDMHVASGKASYEEACGIVAAAGLKMKRCMAAFFLLEKICGRNTSREEKVETLKARFGKNQAALDTLIKKHNRDFASKGGDASFAKACDFFALAGLDGSEAVAPWLLVLKICGKGCSTREEQLAELKAQYGGRQEKLDLLIKKHNKDFASKGGKSGVANARSSTEAGKAFKSLTCIINGETHVFEWPRADLKVVLMRLRQSLGAGKIMDYKELTKKNSVRNAKADAKKYGRTKGQFWVGTTSRKDMHPNLGQKTWPKNSPYVIFFESLEPATTEQDAPGDSDARSAGDQA